jgi:hypothetical protein
MQYNWCVFAGGPQISPQRPGFAHCLGMLPTWEQIGYVFVYRFLDSDVEYNIEDIPR